LVLDGVGGRAPRLLAQVGDVMTAPVISVDPLATVARSLAVAERHGFCHVPIAWADGELVGITCVCDLWGVKRHELVIQHMRAPVVTIGAHEGVLRAADVMRDRHVGSARSRRAPAPRGHHHRGRPHALGRDRRRPASACLHDVRQPTPRAHGRVRPHDERGGVLSALPRAPRGAPSRERLNVLAFRTRPQAR
jgi:CBS domain-containing protein